MANRRRFLTQPAFPITVRAHQLDVTDTLRDYARNRARGHFQRLSRRIGRISIRLEDDNGPKGGADKLCRIKVTIDGQAPAVVTARSEDAYAAVDLAIGKAVRALKHLVDRPRGRRMHDRGRPPRELAGRIPGMARRRTA